MKTFSHKSILHVEAGQSVSFVTFLRHLNKMKLPSDRLSLLNAAIASWQHIKWCHLPHEISHSRRLWTQSDFEFSNRRIFYKALRRYTHSTWLKQYAHGPLKGNLGQCLQHLELFEEANIHWTPGDEAHDVFEEVAQYEYEETEHLLQQDFNSLLSMSHAHTPTLSTSSKALCKWVALLIFLYLHDTQRFKKFREIANLFRDIRHEDDLNKVQSELWQTAWRKYPLVKSNRHQAMGKMVSRELKQRRERKKNLYLSHFGKDLGKAILIEYRRKLTS